MKSGSESTAAQRAPEKDEFVSRKLIRPTLPVLDAKQESPSAAERAPRSERAPQRPDRKVHVQEQTFAENFYFQKQLQNKTTLTVVLKTGDTVNGVVEWYDKSCVKFNRPGKPNLLLYKSGIRYIYKSAEDSKR